MIPLQKALRIASPPRLALVGAGGKTRLMFQLARSFSTRSVLVTTTTHLATGQATLADHHIVVESAADVRKLAAALPDRIVLITGPPVPGQGRIAGLGPEVMAAVHGIAEQREIPLLIEADGSRQRPVKAPADHEPALPQFVDTVLVVAGLSAVGQPLEEAWVHRPDRFAELSGLEPGNMVTTEALARVLTSPAGGLKGIPTGARRLVCLTQAATDVRQAQAADLAERLLPSYNAVLALALWPEADLDDKASPPGEPEDPWPKVHAVYEQIAGIVLAAGGSSRYRGGPKQLLEWGGEPLVRKIARTALEAGLAPVITVLGSAAKEIRPVLHGLPLTIVENPGWEKGQGTSVSAGISACPDQAGGVVFLLVDQPQIPSTLIRALIEAHSRTLAPLIIPQIDGGRGNPVLFDRLTFPELQTLAGDQGGRALFSRHRKEWVPWHDARMLLDIDTAEDYARLVAEMLDP